MKNFFNKIAKFFKTDPNRIGEDGLTRLQRAIIANDVAKVKALLEAGADINMKGGLNYPPLHLSLERDRHAIAGLLIERGADIHLRDMSGRTPLHISVKWNQDFISRTLLHMSADPNMRDNEGRTPLHGASSSNPAMIDILARNGASMNAQDDRGDTPMHLFLAKPRMLERLFANGADPNVRNNAGISPFILVLEDDGMIQNPDVLGQMLRHKADLKSVNSHGETLLFRAARLDMTGLFHNIIEGSDLSQKNIDGNNILHVLARKQSVYLVSSVLAKNTALIRDKNNEGRTPLAEMMERMRRQPALYSFDKFENIARTFLAYGADIDAQDSAGGTLLHYALQYNRYSFVDYLLTRNIGINARDKYGAAALQFAIEKKNIDMLDRLLDAGADPVLTDARGWTVLDRLAEKGDRDSPVVQRLIVGGGQYKKQLPLNPDQIRGKPMSQRDIKKDPFQGPRL